MRKFFSNLRHRLSKKGLHIDNGETVTVTKYIQVHPEVNAFRIKRFTLKWCSSCKVSFGTPDHDHSLQGEQVMVKDQEYIRMIDQKKKSIVINEYSNGQKTMEYR